MVEEPVSCRGRQLLSAGGPRGEKLRDVRGKRYDKFELYRAERRLCRRRARYAAREASRAALLEEGA